MAEHNLKEHIFRLSSIDQAASPSYIRYCFCFSRQSPAIVSDALTKRLAANVKRTVTHLPILAGHLRPATSPGAQNGYLEVVVTLENILNFEGVAKTRNYDDLPMDYDDLERARMPPEAFVDADLSPLAECSEKNAVFAVQANSLSEGFLVTILLHPSVADSVGFATILSHLSSDLPSCKLSNNDLEEISVEQSRLRDRLSGSRGVKCEGEGEKEESALAPALQALTLHTADLATRILFFDLKKVEETTSQLNQHFLAIRNDQQTQVSSFDVLAAVLWKGVARARLIQREELTNEQSSVAISLSIRSIIEPELDDSFFGNAEIRTIATSGVVRLSMPFGVGSLSSAAKLIHDTVKDVDEKQVRSYIADINECPDIRSALISKVDPSTDVVIGSIADIDMGQTDLGLGLGKAGWIRKLGQAGKTCECLVHPIRKEEGLCEVTVQLAESDMDALLKDENFMSFVSCFA